VERLFFFIAAGVSLMLPIALARKAGAAAWGVVLSLGIGLVVAQAAWSARDRERMASANQLRAAVPTLARPGYVSSDNCRSCHPSQYATWHRTYHRTMTQLAIPDAVKGQFTGVKLSAEGKQYVLDRRGDEFWVGIDGEGEKRVMLLTGSHNMQAYWLSTGRGNELVEFPFTYLFEDQRWVPRRDVFLIGPEVPKTAAVWNRICVECHATGGQPGIDEQSGIPDSRVGELGIACEACHGSASEHVRENLNPLRRSTLHQSGESDNTIVNPKRLGALRSSQVCGQCHGIACNLQGWMSRGLPFRPGDDLEQVKPVAQANTLEASPCRNQIAAERSFSKSRYWSDGMVRVSGREYNAIIESRCFSGGKLSCLSCHSMHDSDPDDQLSQRGQSDEACFQCHASFRQNIAAHTHHAPGTAGSACANCHMPFTTYGLLKAIRSHQIDSPSVSKTLETGRPNACNLCHLDKTLDWTANTLSKWFGTPAPPLSSEHRRVSLAVLDALRGDAGQRALIAWSMGWQDAQRASGTGWMTPLLAQLLADRYAAVRYIAYRSLKQLPGFASFEFDFTAGPEQQERAREQALQLWRRSGRAGARAEVLIGTDGDSLGSEVQSWLRQRDDQEMFLAE
jgi:predicted CXXCH cytochrome family protein